MKDDRSSVSLYACMLRWGLHRPTQGRLIRRVLFCVIVVVFGLIGRHFYPASVDYLGQMATVAVFVIAGVAVGWFAFRLINYPPIADFLIDVQLESSKVTWSTWRELQVTTTIVLAAMFMLSFYLFTCDISWQFVLRSLGILNV